MPRILALLLLALALAAALPAADGPTPYPDAKDEKAWAGKGPIRLFDWMPVYRKQYWAQREHDHGAVVFVGDSLTQNWKDLAQAWPGLKVANRGIGGDTSRGVLFRFAEDVLGLKPRAVVMCVGTNDLTAHGDPAGVVGNIGQMVDLARAQDPVLPIVLCLVPPSDNPKAPLKPGAHADLNARIAAYGKGKEHLAVLDLATPLTGPDGKPVAECFTADRLHLAAPGYAKWAEALKPVLAGLGVK